MSAKKRVFDEDLGVELVLDEEVDEVSSVKELDDLANESWGRKRAKIDSSQSGSSQRHDQQPQSRVSNQPHSYLSSRTEQFNFKESELEEDSGSDYDDIDYGDDDDDDDYRSDNPDKSQSQDSKSQNIGPDAYEDDDEEDEENVRGKNRIQNYDGHLDEIEQETDDADHEKEGDEKDQAERCKYWPNCKSGNECAYYHPTKPCRAFPNCRFGTKCLYVHPPCRFNPNCTRPRCPFSHPIAAVPRRQGIGHFKTFQQPSIPKCKYGFKCMNVMCKFFHQKSEPCRFGANCLLDTCPYTHPSDVARKKPASAFKWSAQS